MREVRCLSDSMLPSGNCNEQLKPPEKEDCSWEPCVPDIGQSSLLTSLLKLYGAQSGPKDLII